MAAWKGDNTNPVPDNIREAINRSEKPIGDNRATHVRRDTDEQKDMTISLYDIDETIMYQLEHLQLQVTDQGKKIKVPIFFGAPEKWVSAQRDGYLRDQQGKLILPAMILKRTTSEGDPNLIYLNHRYLQSTLMNAVASKPYSPKNKYTKFSVLAGQNVPVNEVYNIVFPEHMLLTYHFIVWTEYVEQMNELVSALAFNTEDYWGSRKGFRFRTMIDSFSHTTELQVNEDRMVKTEFDLKTHAYILPDTITQLEKTRQTTSKVFTPKKVVFGMEIVDSKFHLDKFPNNAKKWAKPDYPNLTLNTPILKPGIAATTTQPTVEDLSVIKTIVNVLSQSNTNNNSGGNTNLFHLPPPTNSTDVGQEGWVSYDSQYYYVYAGGAWKRVPIALFNTSA